MINNDSFVQDLLENIIRKAVIIKECLEKEAEINCDYALENLKSAGEDLDILIKLCEKKKEEKNK